MNISFDEIVRTMKREFKIRVRRWRNDTGGYAWQTIYTDGRIINWIEAPRPKCLLSLVIFLHEVGHHVIGFKKYKKRCEEELHAWLWALDRMTLLGLVPDDEVIERFHANMVLAVKKARWARIKHLPSPLREYDEKQLVPQAA